MFIYLEYTNIIKITSNPDIYSSLLILNIKKYLANILIHHFIINNKINNNSIYAITFNNDIKYLVFT